MMKLKPIVAGVAVATGVASLGIGSGLAAADPPFCPPNTPCQGHGWPGGPGGFNGPGGPHENGPQGNWGRPDDQHWRGQPPPWGGGPAPWGWGAPPPPPPHGPLPPPWGPPPPAFDYWGQQVNPVFDPGFNQWGFWFFGIWIPL